MFPTITKANTIMKVTDVPQDRAMIEGDLKEVCYAVDDQGRYTLATSAGWDPKNVANAQAWELIKKTVEETLANIEAGKSSPLAYHMVRNQMTIGLLADYVGYSRLKVWWHLKPAGFQRMSFDARRKYAQALNLEPGALDKVPEQDTI